MSKYYYVYLLKDIATETPSYPKNHLRVKFPFLRR